MTKAQAIKESIEHWRRMIAWAERQEGSFSATKMLSRLGEDWYAEYCQLCKEYYKKTGDNHKESCGKCPLYKHIGMACDEKNHVWANFTTLLTKDQWTDNAYKMLKLLEALL